MKKIIQFLLLISLLACMGCARSGNAVPPILATTKPVFDFTTALCQGTDLKVGLLVNDSVSCLHDYSLSTTQIKNVERAELIIISGAGLEDFTADILQGRDPVLDSSEGISLLECHEEHDHQHEADSHIWLSPRNAKTMATNICKGLCRAYPQHEQVFTSNLMNLQQQLDALQCYGEDTLSSLSCRELVTFHNGFAYLADSFRLSILASVEEEDGSMITSHTRIQLENLIEEHHLPAIFTETNGITNSAVAIAKDTGAEIFVLDMCMSGGDYFTNMYRNIDTIKEALG